MLSGEQRKTEKNLLSLEPAELSEELWQRVGKDFSERREAENAFARPLAWFSTATLAAASFTMLIYANFEQTESAVLEVKALEEEVLSVSPTGHEEFRRFRESSYLIEIDQGPVYLDEKGIPVRDTRIKYLDTEVFERLSDGREVVVESMRLELSKSPSVSY